MCLKPIILIQVGASPTPPNLQISNERASITAGQFSEESMNLQRSESNEIRILTPAIGIFPQWLGNIS